ncbi:MAG: glycosyltransferase [Desulfatibacillaceae bacterium]
MEAAWIATTVLGALMWLVILVLPWKPWLTDERIEAKPDARPDLTEVTVLIPARNEADTIAGTLRALEMQGVGIRVVVVDDQSGDGTARAALESGVENLEVVSGASLPYGWAGKMWALEQGRGRVRTRLCLLLDADIELAPGILAAMLEKKRREGLKFVSLMATPRMDGFWDRLLMPAFVYFFKLLYPFAVSNTPSGWVAAAAGGCILVDTEVLGRIGGFTSLKDALIDDCTLARRVKAAGARTYIGLSRDVRMTRPYGGLAGIWRMVARSAYTQLRYSQLLLGLCLAMLMLCFAVPVAGLIMGPWPARLVSAAGLWAMVTAYRPTLEFYGLRWQWGLAMPVIGMLYLGMVLTSAWNYHRGRKSRWKGRTYRV